MNPTRSSAQQKLHGQRNTASQKQPRARLGVTAWAAEIPTAALHIASRYAEGEHVESCYCGGDKTRGNDVGCCKGDHLSWHGHPMLSVHGNRHCQVGK